ncbi:MAG: DUF2490 domain-containing protein [Candidatus Omnitrophica bacterium]|nr:DUF2490 domain-containing protein [Candidatus Omnitrophota bacterium]
MIGVILLAALPAQGKDDFQYWNTLELVKRLNPKWDLFFRPEIRMEDGASHLFYHEYRQGLRWKPSNHLEFGLNYLFARSENSSGKNRDEHTGELDITPKTKWGPWDFSMRGRVALKTVQGSSGEQEFQIRLMPKIAYSMEIFGHKVTPYIANDAFYDYTRKAWNQNRAFLGVVIPMKEVKGVRSSVDLYYMNQSLLGARHDRSSNQILGTKLNVQF